MTECYLRENETMFWHSVDSNLEFAQSYEINILLYCSGLTRYTTVVFKIRERMSPGGFRGLQIRWGALVMSSVGSTPIRSRHLSA